MFNPFVPMASERRNLYQHLHRILATDVRPVLPIDRATLTRLANLLEKDLIDVASRNEISGGAGQDCSSRS